MLFITLAWKTPECTDVPTVLYRGTDSSAAGESVIQAGSEYARIHMEHVLFSIPMSQRTAVPLVAKPAVSAAVSAPASPASPIVPVPAPAGAGDEAGATATETEADPAAEIAAAAKSNRKSNKS